MIKEKIYLTFLLFKKDILFLFREKISFFVPIVFGFVCSVFLSFAIPGNQNSITIMWVVLIFSSFFSAIEIIRIETEEGAIDGLINSPVDNGVIFVSKFLTMYFLFLILSLILLLLFVFFANLNFSARLIFGLFISGIGICSLSVLFSSFIVGENIKIPIYILLLPLFIPPVVSSSLGSSDWIKISFGFSIINFLFSFALFEVKKSI
jgi:ABC-type transport system involved in cytochrome c biogenesis permease component